MFEIFDDAFAFFASLAIFLILLLVFLSIFGFWLWIAALVHAFRQSEADFPDRTLWIVLLIGSLFVGFYWLVGLIYIIIYKASLFFWRNPSNN